MNPGTERNAEVKVSKDSFFEKFIQLFAIKPKIEENVCTGQDTMELLQSIKDARMEWLNANINFEQAVDSDMIDYYTYKIKACEVRYQYLLKEAKEKGIKV